VRCLRTVSCLLIFLTDDSQGSPTPNSPIRSPTTFIPPEPIQPGNNIRKEKIISQRRMSPVGCFPGPGPIENFVAQDDTFDPNDHNGVFHFQDYDHGDGGDLEEEEFFNSNYVAGSVVGSIGGSNARGSSEGRSGSGSASGSDASRYITEEEEDQKEDDMEEGVDEEDEEKEAEPVEENNDRNPDAEFNPNEADVDSDDSDFAPNADSTQEIFYRSKIFLYF
jgi:hypothetical protein